MAHKKPFLIVPLKNQSFFQKLIKRHPQENAFIEVNNLLSQTKDIKDISIEEIENIAFRYKVKIHKKFKTEFQGLYRRFLKYCFDDKILTDDEIEYLAHLKLLFNLNDKTIDQIHEDVYLEVFNESVDEVIKDGKLDQREREFLEKLQTQLKLPDEVVRNIYSKKATAYLEDYLKTAILDERLSPDEEKELQTIAKNLGLTLKFDEKTQQLLDKFRLYWLIENGEIPVVPADINLQKNEKCYFAIHAKWYEYRRVTERVRYGGPTYRLKLAKGLHWRVGDLGVQAVSNDTLTLIDNGILYLTNKRIILIGSKNTKTIRHTKILNLKPYKNGVEIFKDAGKSPFLEFEKGADVFSMILNRVISEI